jgi:hypothetical protein
MGCYTTRPIAGQGTALGSTLVLSINDAGRAALAGSMGPAISEIEGRLLEKDSSEYVLAVAQIHMFGGADQVWSGERVRIKSGFVNTVSEKKFSKTKTGLIAAAAVGVVAIVISKGIIGNWSGSDGQTPGDTGVAVRYPRFVR